mmetsp:Transcript_24241/g.55184  ORF Transcript_24241/g.55184 Transcript_24241/m.55184 type:complete len:82 (-) Transcript_24241:1635-1880(-)
MQSSQHQKVPMSKIAATSSIPKILVSSKQDMSFNTDYHIHPHILHLHDHHNLLHNLRRDEKQTMPGPPSSKLTNRKERYNH